MQVLVKTKFNVTEKREFIATLASAMVEASGEKSPYKREGLPYKPNDWDDSFWTIDSGNDWKIKFYSEDKSIFEIIHRYQINDNRTEYSSVNEAVKSLAGLLAYRLSGKVEIK